jgi:hypothetical protein
LKCQSRGYSHNSTTDDSQVMRFHGRAS